MTAVIIDPHKIIKRATCPVRLVLDLIFHDSSTIPHHFRHNFGKIHVIFCYVLLLCLLFCFAFCLLPLVPLICHLLVSCLEFFLHSFLFSLQSAHLSIAPLAVLAGATALRRYSVPRLRLQVPNSATTWPAVGVYDFAFRLTGGGEVRRGGGVCTGEDPGTLMD